MTLVSDPHAPWYTKLHIQIFIAMAVGATLGLTIGPPAARALGWLGTVFVQGLNMVIVPLVFTSLTKEAFPIIRYRTRDITRLLPGTARTMRRMERVGGRTDDMLIIRGVNVFPSQIEAEILKVSGLSPHFVCEVATAGNMKSLTIRVEPKPNALVEGLADELAALVKSNVGVTAEVRVEEPGVLPRSQGKAQRVRDAT